MVALPVSVYESNCHSFKIKKNMVPMLIQTRRWLMQPKIWRFVGFASAVVGLLCYAFSSSFNHLFGHWNLLKLFLYSVFSFIISLMILYANIWKHSRSLRFKAHTAFLVLTITSVYSFFFDKVVNGKPDAYSLISCAAFAIMSLSLSRQTQCGFEVDLLYFFLGCLIVLLMKIKLQLVIVGVGFSYCLIIIRSSLSSTEAPLENEYLGLEDEHSVVIEVDSPPQLAIADIASTMQQLTTCVMALEQENSNLINRLLELVKKYREDLDRLLASDLDFAMDALPSGMINDLHETAKLVVGAGFEKECSHIYSNWRRGFLQEFLINRLLELQGINIDDEHRRVEYLDMVIERWMTASKIAVNLLFPFERRLCDRVFSGFTPSAVCFFTDVCQAALFQLLTVADAVANGSPSTWRFFKMLQIFKELCYLIPKFESLFPDSLVKIAIAVKNKVGEASRDLFMELDKLIFRVPVANQVAPADGQHHPITMHVMSDIRSACSSRRTLEQILQEYPKFSNGVEASSLFIGQMEQIMMLLEKKLIAKSKNNWDPALRYLFMVNNRRHVEAMNKAWQLGTIFGNDWFRKNEEKIQQNLELYKRSSWNKVLDFLKFDNNEPVAAPNDNATAELLKDKLNLFNRHFKEISRVQSTWSIYDKELREEIITSVGNMLLPAYEIFIGRLQDILGNQAYEYIEYGMFEIQDRLNHMFV